MRILLVEDDAMIGKTLSQALKLDGYAVDWVTDGQAGRLALDTTPDGYALVLLDLGLPRKSGLDLLKELRQAGTKVRVLMARRALERSDRAVGTIALDLGFYDQSHFTRVFRWQTGLTPLAYRQRFRS